MSKRKFTDPSTNFLSTILGVMISAPTTAYILSWLGTITNFDEYRATFPVMVTVIVFGVSTYGALSWFIAWILDIVFDWSHDA